MCFPVYGLISIRGYIDGRVEGSGFTVQGCSVDGGMRYEPLTL